MKKISLFLGLSTFLVLVVTGIVSAQEAQPTPSDDQVNAIARQLYCPVCENTPLDVCPTTACAQWRDLIRQELAAGKSEGEIKDMFVQQYGARVLGTPPPKGINLLVYIIPLLAVAAGVYILYHLYRSWKQPVTEAVSASPAADVISKPDGAQDEYIHRLEEEVRKG
ncbi:MAG: cytochrome c-type biogenesis protein CcmH [Acidobacteriaceae bacterium]